MTTVQYFDLKHRGRFGRKKRIDADDDPLSQQARQHIEMSLSFLETVLKRTGVPNFQCCIHWGSRLANAMWWDGKLFLGDGDDCHRPYAQSLSIVMHELIHNIIEQEEFSNVDESRAVTEHLCDVFGILVKQWQQSMSGLDNDWLFGSEIRICTDTGAAIRNMLDPSSNARDKGAMSWSEASRDPTKVYYNAGVLNRAFALATESIDALPWESTGPVWHRALSSLTRYTDIPKFAKLVVASAGEYDTEVAAAFRKVGFAV